MVVKVTLLSDWKKILKKAWSVRLVLLSGLLSGVEIILPLYIDSLPRGIFATLSILTAVGATVARVVAQPKMDSE